MYNLHYVHISMGLFAMPTHNFAFVYTREYENIILYYSRSMYRKPNYSKNARSYRQLGHSVIPVSEDYV